jgi:hypothetical protein
MSHFRVIVTGSRDYPCEDDVWEALAMALAENCDPGDTFTVVHGACETGADAYAASWMCLPDGGSGVTIVEEPHPADWNTCTPGCFHWPRADGRCPAAGPRRNAEMVALGAHLVLAFPLAGDRKRSRGTWDCIAKAEAVGIRVEKQTPSMMPRFRFADLAEAFQEARDE